MYNSAIVTDANVRISALHSNVIPFLKNRYGSDHPLTQFKEYELLRLEAGSFFHTKSSLTEYFFPRLQADRKSDSSPIPEGQIRGLIALLAKAPGFVSELVKNSDPDAFLSSMAKMVSQSPTLLIPAHLGFPMGGGEAFLFDNCVLTSELGWRNIWISYLDPIDGWNQFESEIEKPFYVEVKRVGPPSEKSLVEDFDLFSPDVVHSHGAMAQMVKKVCSESRVPCLIGYHFWTGLVELGTTENIKIRENIGKHRLFEGKPSKRSSERRVIEYVASEFMVDVLKDLKSPKSYEVIHPIPLKVSPNEARQSKDDKTDLLLMNAHPRKGGYLLPHLSENLREDIHIKAVVSESGSEDFYSELRKLEATTPNLHLVNYQPASELYATAKVLIAPSTVDETFGRVVYEAVMNDIPVFSSSSGFIPYQLGDSGVYLDEEPSNWANLINRVFFDDKYLANVAKAQKQSLTSRVSSNLEPLLGNLLNLADTKPKNQIGIFTIWGDQGLGNQAREYSRELRSMGFKVHIFSFQSYLSQDTHLKFQRDPSDWESPVHADSVHYSFNSREHVTVHELKQFVLANNIGTLLVPEICWDVNWHRLLELSQQNLAILGIPNIEIVRKEELSNHNLITGNLYPTKQCKDVLERHGVKNGSFVGYAHLSLSEQSEIIDRRTQLSIVGKIKYLHVAGANPVTRKNTPKILSAFLQAAVVRPDIELTITTLVPIETYFQGQLPASVTVIESDLSRQAVEALYLSHDASVQVSSHEGIGLGFHESVMNGCPVISLNVPPHNETIKEGTTGWLIAATPSKMLDNNSSLVPSWKFEERDLTRIFKHLTKEEISSKSQSCLALATDVRSYLVHVLNFSESLLSSRQNSFTNQIDSNFSKPKFSSYLLLVLSKLAQSRLANLVPQGFKIWVYTSLRRRIQRKDLAGLF